MTSKEELPAFKIANHLYWLERAFCVEDLFAALQLVNEMNVDVNIKSSTNGTTLLMAASANVDKQFFQNSKCCEVIQQILTRGADVNLINKNGKSALMFAADTDPDGECISLLIKAKADVNAQDNAGWTALMYAAARLSDKNVKILLEAGANKILVNKKGNNAWDIATSKWINWCPETVLNMLRR